MTNTMWKLDNVIKEYDWGSHTELQKHFNIANPNHHPQAELWMGIHPSGISHAISMQGERTALDQLILKNPIDMLGEKIASTYHTLPYLFKILSASNPLSIQVHPSLEQAKQGYATENARGIALDSPQRNYKDPNHKPELIYALTPFLAMNGFRPVTEIISLFESLQLNTIAESLQKFIDKQSDDGLRNFFHHLLTLNEETKKEAITELLAKISHYHELPFTLIKSMSSKYPNDSGLFSPLILNVIQLQPKQAMFLSAQTPHAYLQGTGLEIMANSDNVLRAGLTPKHIDVEELFSNTTFHSIEANALLKQPIIKENKIDFPVPVNDFAFEIIESDQQCRKETIHSGEIILCITGEVTLSTTTDKFTIQSGESVFIACCANEFSYQGSGTLARAFNH